MTSSEWSQIEDVIQKSSSSSTVLSRVNKKVQIISNIPNANVYGFLYLSISIIHLSVKTEHSVADKINTNKFL